MKPSLLFVRPQTTLFVMGHVCVWVWKTGKPLRDHAIQERERCALAAKLRKEGLVLVMIMEPSPQLPDKEMRDELREMFESLGDKMLGLVCVYECGRFETALARSIVRGWLRLQHCKLRHVSR